MRVAGSAGRRLLRVSGRLYALALHAFPMSFREESGREAAEAFRDGCREALRERGRTALALAVLRGVADAVDGR
jgi:hypothetical protein